MLKRRHYLMITVLILLLDQFTKYLAVQYLSLGRSLPVFWGFDLALRYNTGAAFSFLAEASGWQRWFFVGLALVMSVIIFIWLGRITSKKKLEAFGLALILGGALGNAWDRVMNGRVTDFIVLYYKTWEWPAFNIADAAISIGVVLFVLQIFSVKAHKDAIQH